MTELLPLQDHDSNAKESIAIDPVTGKKVIMKDGKPCRACTDMKTWSRMVKQTAKSEKAAQQPAAATPTKIAPAIESPTTESPTTAATGNVDAEEEWRKKNCPADVETLGQSSWTLLHTMAAYYPEKPSPYQKSSMKQFMESFAEHYPCWFCKNDFQKAMAAEPVEVDNRTKLSQWLCRRHNEVNAKLNKPQFDCSKVFERWLEGPPGGKCD